ncbi:MAG: heme NO-binding domain-containing protein [Myxococcota bacterium]
MKGVVFTEFNEMVEARFGVVVADSVLTHSRSDGVYTAVGDYDYKELIEMVVALSKETEAPVEALVEAFGYHLFGRFADIYPEFFEGVAEPLDFLEEVEERIHVQVRKLYPTAALPRFATERDGDTLHMHYRSPRCLGDLARGLIRGCLDHFGRKGTVKDSKATPDGSEVHFTVTLDGD